MSSNEDLVRLFAELKTAASPLRRMKILGRAWRTLRRLSPKARKDLAAQVGIDGAEDVLEQLAGKNRVLSPAAFLAALEALRGTSPEDLQRALADLKRPDGRRALVDRTLDVLAGGSAEEPSAPLSPAPATVLDAVPLNDTPDEPPTSRQPVVAGAAGAGVAAAATKLTTPVQRQPVTRETRRGVEGRSRPARPITPVESIKPTRPVEPPRPAAAPAAGVRKVVAPPERPAPKPGPGLVDALDATDRLPDKFRLLYDRMDEARGLPVEELRRLIETFPTEWSRRRALSGLLDRRIPRDLHRAIFLIESLDSRLSQRWCVARILRVWPLAQHEREALLARRGTFIRGAVQA